METLASSRYERIKRYLCEIYSRVGGESDTIFIPPRPASGIFDMTNPEMREITESLEKDGFVTVTRRGSVGLTAKGSVEAERAMDGKEIHQLDAPFPKERSELIEEMNYWAQRQHEGQSGSPHWEAVGSRIEQLRYLAQIVAEEERFETMANIPKSIVQNNYGVENPRILVNSTDNSSNITMHGEIELFKKVREEIDKHIPEGSSRSELKSSLGEISRSYLRLAVVESHR